MHKLLLLLTPLALYGQSISINPTTKAIKATYKSLECNFIPRQADIWAYCHENKLLISNHTVVRGRTLLVTANDNEDIHVGFLFRVELDNKWKLYVGKSIMYEGSFN